MVKDKSTEVKSRFDAKLPREQKLKFERAATIGGFRNLTDFMFSAAEELSERIIEKKQQIIASKRDAEIFFQALSEPAEPNEVLLNAAKMHEQMILKKNQ